MKYAAIFASLLLLTACNTMSGVGKDISGAGKGLSNASESTKEAITKPKNEQTGYYDDQGHFHYYEDDKPSK